MYLTLYLAHTEIMRRISIMLLKCAGPCEQIYTIFSFFFSKHSFSFLSNIAQKLSMVVQYQYYSVVLMTVEIIVFWTTSCETRMKTSRRWG